MCTNALHMLKTDSHSRLPFLQNFGRYACRGHTCLHLSLLHYTRTPISQVTPMAFMSYKRLPHQTCFETSRQGRHPWLGAAVPSLRHWAPAATSSNIADFTGPESQDTPGFNPRVLPNTHSTTPMLPDTATWCWCHTQGASTPITGRSLTSHKTGIRGAETRPSTQLCANTGYS